MATRDERTTALYGNRFLTEEAPSAVFPAAGMSPTDTMRMLGEDLALEGDPMRNLATFVTTWMEPEAQRIIAENLHRNFIDHAEYPISAEIEQRCVRMLADLFNADGIVVGGQPFTEYPAAIPHLLAEFAENSIVKSRRIVLTRFGNRVQGYAAAMASLASIFADPIAARRFAG